MAQCANVGPTTQLADSGGTASPHSDDPSDFPPPDLLPPDFLPHTGQRFLQGGRGGSDNDIYHEYGTVIPGGGRHFGGQPGDGGMVVGPGGVITNSQIAKPKQEVQKPRAPTREEKQAQIRKAMRPPEPAASLRSKALSILYAKLASSNGEADAKAVAGAIETVWAHSGSPTADLLAARADQAAAGKNYGLALELLDRVVQLRPEWAEGWNKRASVKYLSGDLDGATADVDRVLKLEPKHFAALNGLAMILQRTGFDKRALQVYRRELAVYPHQPALEALVEKLTTEVEGQGI